MGNYSFIQDRISQIQREIGMTNFTGFFEMAIEGLSGITEQTKLPMDVYHAQTALPEIRKTVKSLHNNGRFVFNDLDDPKKVGISSFPGLQSAVALLFLDEDFLESDFLQELMLKKKTDYRLIFYRNFSADLDIVTLLRKYFPSHIELIDLSSFVTQTDDLFAQIERSISVSSYTHEKLLDLSINQSVTPIIEALRDLISTESKIAATQKQLAVQDNVILRKEEPGSLNSEISTATRQILQKNMLDTEKAFKAKYEEKNKSNIGEFYLQSDIFASMLSFDDLHQQDIAEKSEKIETQIKDSKLADYKKSIAAGLRADMQQDLNFLDTSAAETITKINHLLQEKGLKKIDSNNLVNPSIFIENTISANNYFQRNYTGEVTKKGVMEYFVALRDYTGIIMVVVGLFAPLTMLSSVPTDEKEGIWAFLSAASLYLKQAKTFIQVFTIITIFFMIIYGIFDLRKRIPRKRQEEKDREVKKARENLMQEGKRIYSDTSRDWIAALANYIREFAQNISNEVEQIIKGTIAAKQQALSDKRIDFQINQQSVDLKIKNIQLAEKEYELLYRRLMETNNKLTS
ncbi:hypothetical protein [Sphingobacterium multivorum]|uniref:hypothetical protein n=1 Tax=Sphingobacterium multivorum TaxID=28454 RepID=UPI0028B0ACBA|nr:hypothetical protein [Sphingobacterium multivorum]